MMLTNCIKFNFVWIIFLLPILWGSAQNIVTISGVVREKGSKEVLIGANIAHSNFSEATSTNSYGIYSLSLPKGHDSIQLNYSFIGYKQQIVYVSNSRDLRLDVELEPESKTLQTVVVKATPQYLTPKI